MDSSHVLLDALRTEHEDDLPWYALADALDDEGKPEQAQLTRLGLKLRDMSLSAAEANSIRTQQNDLLIAGHYPCLPTIYTPELSMTFVLIRGGTRLDGCRP